MASDRPDYKLTGAIGRLGRDTLGYVCPWCGTREHRVWVGDHVVPLARLLGSPIVAAGKGCNTSRRGVRASSLQMGRLFRPELPLATHSGDEIRRFCEEWAAKRYGSTDFLDLAIGDSGPLVPICRRDRLRKKTRCQSGQRIADKAYVASEDYTSESLAEVREAHNRQRMVNLKPRVW